MFFNVSLQFQSEWKAAPPNLPPEALPGTISFLHQEMVLGQEYTLSTFSDSRNIYSRDALIPGPLEDTEEGTRDPRVSLALGLLTEREG